MASYRDDDEIYLVVGDDDIQQAEQRLNQSSRRCKRSTIIASVAVFLVVAVSVGAFAGVTLSQMAGSTDFTSVEVDDVSLHIRQPKAASQDDARRRSSSDFLTYLDASMKIKLPKSSDYHDVEIKSTSCDILLGSTSIATMTSAFLGHTGRAGGSFHDISLSLQDVDFVSLSEIRSAWLNEELTLLYLKADCSFSARVKVFGGVPVTVSSSTSLDLSKIVNDFIDKMDATQEDNEEYNFDLHLKGLRTNNSVDVYTLQWPAKPFLTNFKVSIPDTFFIVWTPSTESGMNAADTATQGVPECEMGENILIIGVEAQEFQLISEGSYVPSAHIDLLSTQSIFVSDDIHEQLLPATIQDSTGAIPLAIFQLTEAVTQGASAVAQFRTVEPQDSLLTFLIGHFRLSQQHTTSHNVAPNDVFNSLLNRRREDNSGYYEDEDDEGHFQLILTLEDRWADEVLGRLNLTIDFLDLSDMDMTFVNVSVDTDLNSDNFIDLDMQLVIDMETEVVSTTWDIVYGNGNDLDVLIETDTTWAEGEGTFTITTDHDATLRHDNDDLMEGTTVIEVNEDETSISVSTDATAQRIFSTMSIRFEASANETETSTLNIFTIDIADIQVKIDTDFWMKLEDFDALTVQTPINDSNEDDLDVSMAIEMSGDAFPGGTMTADMNMVMEVVGEDMQMSASFETTKSYNMAMDMDIDFDDTNPNLDILTITMNSMDMTEDAQDLMSLKSWNQFQLQFGSNEADDFSADVDVEFQGRWLPGNDLGIELMMLVQEAGEDFELDGFWKSTSETRARVEMTAQSYETLSQNIIEIDFVHLGVFIDEAAFVALDEMHAFEVKTRLDSPVDDNVPEYEMALMVDLVGSELPVGGADASINVTIQDGFELLAWWNTTTDVKFEVEANIESTETNEYDETSITLFPFGVVRDGSPLVAVKTWNQMTARDYKNQDKFQLIGDVDIEGSWVPGGDAKFDLNVEFNGYENQDDTISIAVDLNALPEAQAKMTVDVTIGDPVVSVDMQAIGNYDPTDLEMNLQFTIGGEGDGSDCGGMNMTSMTLLDHSVTVLRADAASTKIRVCPEAFNATVQGLFYTKSVDENTEGAVKMNFSISADGDENEDDYYYPGDYEGPVRREDVIQPQSASSSSSDDSSLDGQIKAEIVINSVYDTSATVTTVCDAVSENALTITNEVCNLIETTSTKPDDYVSMLQEIGVTLALFGDLNVTAEFVALEHSTPPDVQYFVEASVAITADSFGDVSDDELTDHVEEYYSEQTGVPKDKVTATIREERRRSETKTFDITVEVESETQANTVVSTMLDAVSSSSTSLASSLQDEFPEIGTVTTVYVSAPSTRIQQNASTGGLGAGAIAGIAVGCIFGVVLVAVIVVLVLRGDKNESRVGSSTDVVKDKKLPSNVYENPNGAYEPQNLKRDV